MKQSIHHYRRHNYTFEYIILLLLMLTGFFSFVRNTGEPRVQMQIGLVTAVAYTSWGLYHHWQMRDLNWKIVLEYSAIALLGAAILWALLLFVT